MRILVIGGAGYIGSHVVKELMKGGHEIAVFDDLSTGLAMNLFPENKFIKGSILNTADLDAAFSAGYDAAVHLAALKAAGESMLVPEQYSVHNISGTINILNSAAAHGCLKLLFSSSAAIFGDPQYLPINEGHPKNPANYYGFTKFEIERFMEWYDRLKGLKFAALRYFNAAGYDPEGVLYGLEQNPANLLPVIMEAACGMRKEVSVFGADYDTRDGTCIRDYVHVADLAAAHVLSLDYLVREGKSLRVNLGSEKGVSVREMIEAARRITGQPIPSEDAPRRPGDPACLVASSSYARETLGWQPACSDIDTLVASTWQAYRKNCQENSCKGVFI
ncbi:MAG: UDP-glucose 4-epimerase GalE [Treponema sp.]|jgi:UDP-glucose 4-epimerase|nr:UDP-glucose 4-epimerase GalE [Treponema sp.]